MPHVHVNGGTLDAITILSGGTVNIGGTPTVKAVGGTIAMLQAGTISSLPAITGSVAVTSGTITELPAISGTVGVSAGTIDAATLATGTAHIGQVGGHTSNPAAATLTLSTASYSAGDLLGTLMTLVASRVPGQGFGITQVEIADLGKQDKPLDVVFFSEAPGATAFTDNAALDVDDADLPKVIGHVNVGTAQYCDFNDNSIATVRNVGLGCNTASGTLWYCHVTRGTPTYGTADLTCRLGIVQD